MTLNIRFAGPPGPTGTVDADLAALQSDVVTKAAQVTTDKSDTLTARDLARAYANNSTDVAIAGAVSSADRGARYWSIVAAASAASVPVPASQSEVDAASGAKGVLANQLGRIYARLGYAEERSGIYNGVAMSAPYIQRFTGGPAAITTLTGWASAFANGGSSGQLTALTFGNGSAGGDGNAYSAIAAYYDASAITGDLWVGRTRNIAVGGGNVDHFSISATLMSTLRMTVTQASAGGLKTSGIYGRNYRASGGVYTSTFTTSADGNIGGAWVDDGDNVTNRYVTVGGVTTMSTYLNGRHIGGDIIVSGKGVAFSNKFGFLGDVPSQSLDEMRIGSATNDALISLYQPNRVVQQIYDGVNLTATWYLRGEYTQNVPVTLYYTLFDKSSGSSVAVTGHTDARVSNLVAASGAYTCQFTVNAAVIATGGPYYVEIYRKNVVNLITGAVDVSTARGPIQRIGDGVLWSGQSLGVGASREAVNSVVLSSYIAGSQFVNGEAVVAGLAFAHEHPMSDNTNQSYFSAKMGAVNGAKPTIYAAGGLSNTTVATRGPGSATYNCLVDTVYRTAQYDGHVIWVDGQSNTGLTSGGIPLTPQQTQDLYYNDMVITWTALRLVFPNLKCVLTPMAGQWVAAGTTSGDGLDNAIRVAQWRLCNDYPAIFLWGPHMMDLQHADALHLKTETVSGELGYAEYNRRVAYFLAKKRNYAGATYDRNGPTMASVARIDAQTIEVTYNLNGFDSIDLINSAVNSEYHGGMTFATATTFATRIYPTGFTLGAVVAGQQKITFTFPTNTFPGTAYARAVYGSNPFNPTNITAVNDDVQGKASMIVGVKAGEPNVSLQPYVTLTGYMSS